MFLRERYRRAKSYISIYFITVTEVVSKYNYTLYKLINFISMKNLKLNGNFL